MARSRVVHGEVLCTDMADTGARRGYCTDTRATGEHVGDEGLVHGKEDGNGRPKRLRSRASPLSISRPYMPPRSSICGLQRSRVMALQPTKNDLKASPSVPNYP